MEGRLGCDYLYVSIVLDEKMEFCRVNWMNWFLLGGEGGGGDGIVTTPDQR